MENSINTYGGLMQDAAFDSIKSSLYIDAKDVRITTDKGESQGAITNIQGNEEAFTIPQNDTGSQIGLKEIIGVATIREKIIIFTTDDSGNNGWIYYVEYNVQTRVINPATPRLIYDANGDPSKLLFKKNYPIEAVGRFESQCTQRIYWTDYNNFIRSLNIEDFNSTSSPITTNISVLDIFPDVTYTQPIIKEIATGGGNTKAGMYQFAYRLRTFDGKISLISPPSHIIHLIGPSDRSTPSGRMMGSKKGTVTGKTVTIRIDISDYIGIYETIELIGVFYEDYTGTAEVFIIETNTVPQTGQFIDILYSGSEESITTIDPLEYAIKVYPFKTAKTMVPKDNSLVIANIKQNFFSIGDLLANNEEFNAQTYRYNSSSALPGPAGDNDTKFNVKYNSDKHWMGSWHELEQYKYKINGTTLGGQSLATTAPIGTGTVNISYQFTVKKRLIDSDIQPGYKNVFLPASSTDNSYGDGYTYYNGSYDNDGSAFITGLSRGYKRGETYRFGIIFYNKKGEASYVEYIGDIKFPDISEKDDIDRETSTGSTTNYFPIAIQENESTSSNECQGFDLGLEFTLDFSSCPSVLNQIVSWQIVRVPRLEKDKRRVCSGILRGLKEIAIGEPASNNVIWDFRGNQDSEDVLHPYVWPWTTSDDANEGIAITLMNGQWTLVAGNDQLEFGLQGTGTTFTEDNSPDPVSNHFQLFYSPEVSYNWQLDAIPIGGDPSSGLLITGAYGTFSGSPNDNLNSTNILVPWFDEQTDHGMAGLEEIRGKNGAVRQYQRKLRYTTPIDKETSLGVYNDTTYPVEYRGVEYFRGIYDSFYMSNNFAHGQQEGEDKAKEVCLKTYPTFTPSKPVEVRNLYADCKMAPGSGAGYRLNWPDNDSQTILGRGARCLCVGTKAQDVDPFGGSVSPATSNRFRTYGGDTWTGVVDGSGNPVYHYVWPIVANSGIYSTNVSPYFYPLGSTGPTRYQDSLFSTPAVDMISFKTEIYGGYTKSALDNNVFQPCSALISVNNITNVKVFGGDTFLGMFELVITSAVLAKNPFRGDSSGSNRDFQFRRNTLETIVFPVETGMQLDLAWGDTPQKGAEQYWGSEQQRFLRQEFGNLTIGGGSTTTAPQETNEGTTSTNAYTGRTAAHSGIPADSIEEPLYNPVYNLDNKRSPLVFFVKPDTLGDCGIDDTRAYLSDTKINEELVDSWTIFRTENIYNVESVYGPINKIINWNDTVYFFQDKGVGSYSINPRAVTTTDDGQPTELGSGEGFAHHSYYSTEFGSIHQWAVKATDIGIYYFDAIHKKIFKIGKEGNQPLSEIGGMHSFLEPANGPILSRKLDAVQGDNPILNKGVVVERDKQNDEVLFTFRGFNQYRDFGYQGNGGAQTYNPDERVFVPRTEPAPTEGDFYQIGENPITTNDDEGFSANRSKLIAGSKLVENEFTLVYDELAGQFSSFYTATPPIYIENGDILISPNPTDRKTTFTHNKGNWGEIYGEVTESYVKLVINPNADINKVLRFIEFNSIVNSNEDIAVDRALTITAFRVQTEYQDTGKTAFSSERIKRRFDKWRVKIPRDQLSINKRGRLRSTYFILTLYYDNTYNKELILNRVMSHYDIQIY